MTAPRTWSFRLPAGWRRDGRGGTTGPALRDGAARGWWNDLVVRLLPADQDGLHRHPPETLRDDPEWHVGRVAGVRFDEDALALVGVVEFDDTDRGHQVAARLAALHAEGRLRPSGWHLDQAGHLGLSEAGISSSIEGEDFEETHRLIGSRLLNAGPEVARAVVNEMPAVHRGAEPRWERSFFPVGLDIVSHPAGYAGFLGPVHEQETSR